MHELGVTFHIMEHLEKVAKENEVEKIRKVHVLCCCGFARHGYVASSHVKQTHGIQRCRYLIFFDIKSHVAIIQIMIAEAEIVHIRGS